MNLDPTSPTAIPGDGCIPDDQYAVVTGSDGNGGGRAATRAVPTDDRITDRNILADAEMADASRGAARIVRPSKVTFDELEVTANIPKTGRRRRVRIMVGLQPGTCHGQIAVRDTGQFRGQLDLLRRGKKVTSEVDDVGASVGVCINDRLTKLRAPSPVLMTVEA